MNKTTCHEEVRLVTHAAQSLMLPASRAGRSRGQHHLRTWAMSLLLLLLAACGAPPTEDHVDEHGHGDDKHADEHGNGDAKKDGERSPGDEKGEHGPGEDNESDEDAHDDEKFADEHGHGGEEHSDEEPKRTTIAAAMAVASGIRTAKIGPGEIRDEHEVQGLIIPVEGRQARVVARFPGPVRQVKIGVGDVVRAGQTLAVIESNISLSNYSVTSPLAGTVLARNTAVGDLAGDAPLFEIADLTKLWVDLHLFGADAQHITPGLPVEVIRLSDSVSAQTKLDRVLPGTATASQSTVARATVDNSDGLWRIGAAVRARVTVSVESVALQVPLSALQTLDGADVAFVLMGEVYEAHPLKLGRRDGVNVEVLEGLNVGDEVVVEQSYIVKADIEKSGASHDH